VNRVGHDLLLYGNPSQSSNLGTRGGLQDRGHSSSRAHHEWKATIIHSI
jgi:hypothetical protein